MSKIKTCPSPARLGFWNLNSGPTDSNPSKSRAEFGWGQNSAPRAEQNFGGLRSCEGEDLSSAHLGSRDDPNETEPPPTPPDSGFWILHSGFWILDSGFGFCWRCMQARPISTNLASICEAGTPGFWILDFAFWTHACGVHEHACSCMQARLISSHLASICAAGFWILESGFGWFKHYHPDHNP